MRRLLGFGLGMAFVFGSAYAQQDTTAPNLLDFSISPILFDTTSHDVMVSWCVTAQDDLSGTANVAVRSDSPLVQPHSGFFAISMNFEGASDPTQVCTFAIVPIGSPLEVQPLAITLTDRVGNTRTVANPVSPICPLSGPCENLCALGFPCSLENRSLSSSPDADGDGIPDVADDCPSVSNSDQADLDHDGVGDACDPFPEDPDNDQAQCDASLAQAQSDLSAAIAQLAAAQAALAAATADSDGDQVRDQADRCPGTPAATPVDRDGCSVDQFCARIDAVSENGKKVCSRSDWGNDEPLSNNPDDCVLDRRGHGPSDDRCVAVPHSGAPGFAVN